MLIYKHKKQRLKDILKQLYFWPKLYCNIVEVTCHSYSSSMQYDYKQTNQQTVSKTIVSRPHHDTEEPPRNQQVIQLIARSIANLCTTTQWIRTRKHGQARYTEPPIARSTARPTQPLHLPEIRCRYLRTVNKLLGVPTEPE